MYDTIRVINYMCEVGKSAEELKKLLHEPTSYTNKNGVTSYRGVLGNLTVIVNDTKITITGSLPKFIYGNNIQTLTREDTKKAFDKISDTLKIDLTHAEVKRLDVASTFIMDNSPSDYLTQLESYPYARRNDYNGETLNFILNNKAIKFYDKTLECKKKKFIIPDNYNDKNLLRFEIMYERRLKEQFKELDKITVPTLYNERFYNYVQSLYYQEFSKVKKKQSIIPHKGVVSNCNKPKEAHTYLEALFLSCLSENELKSMQAMFKEYKAFKGNTKEYYRFKSEINKLCSNPNYTVQSELIKELDNKIKEVVSNNSKVEVQKRA